MATIPQIEFAKGIPPDLEHDSYFDVNKHNLIVSDEQMIDTGGDTRIANLFTRGSHHRNLSVIYIVQNLFYQGKGSQSISLNSHYLVLFKNPRDKLQIVTLVKQMYPGQTHFFIQRYEKPVWRPFGYLLLEPLTIIVGYERTYYQENKDLIKVGCNTIFPRTTALSQAAEPSDTPVLPATQQLRDNMDGLLSLTDLGEYEKAR